MNITAEEKLMYSVMKAIYDSGIPISFKGSMVMKAYLMEAGYTEETRHTVEIGIQTLRPQKSRWLNHCKKRFRRVVLI